MGIVAITMGDPAGIGPEIILKAYKMGLLVKHLPCVIGDIGVMEYYNRLLKLDVPLKGINDISEIDEEFLCVISITDIKEVTPGVSNRVYGDAVYRYIVYATNLCLSGKTVGMVTAPISKVHMQMAGWDYPGHTELIASICNVKNYAMMLFGGGIRVSLVTTHMALRDVADAITKERVYNISKLTCDELVRIFRIDMPKVAVCGLNPHAGESGAFGNEEVIIKNAVDKLAGQGYAVSGPYPADTVFYFHKQGRFDAVVAMYHDQGLIPVKLLGFEEGVNITLGLPFIRTSPDHGTAFDIAGKGIANFKSFVAAYRVFAGVDA